MTRHDPPADDDVSRRSAAEDSREGNGRGALSLDRRTVLKSMAVGAVGSGFSTAVADAESNADADDLGAWTILQNHELPAVDLRAEDYDTPPVSNIRGRNAIRSTYGISHVDTKIPDASGDVAQSECDGQPGIQHRFVANSFTFGRTFYEGNTQPLQAIDDFSLEVNAPGGCGSVSLILNDAFQYRTSISEFTKEGASTDYGAYEDGRIKEKTERAMEGRRFTTNPAMPTDPVSMRETMSLTLNTAFIVGGFLAGGPGGAATAGTYASIAVPAIVNTIYGPPDSCEYRPEYVLEDNRIKIAETSIDCGGPDMRQGSAVLNFIDFTVTVPPNTETTITVDHGADYVDLQGRRNVVSPDDMEDVSPTFEDGTDVDEHMVGGHTWEMSVPAIDLGESFSDIDSSRLPRPTTDYSGPPEPEIELGGNVSFDDLDTRTEVEFQVANVDDFERARWRVYKRDASPKRPAIGYGTSFTWLFGQAEKSNRDVEDPAFGAGDYAVDLIVFDEKKAVGTARREFEVDEAGQDDPPHAKIALEGSFLDDEGRERTVEVNSAEDYNGYYTFAADTALESVTFRSQLDRTVTLDGSDSVDAEEDDLRTSSDGIDNYVWYVETPDGMDDVWQWGQSTQLELDIDEPGTYTAELTIVTLISAFEGLADADGGEVISDELFDDDGSPLPGTADRAAFKKVKSALDDSSKGTYDSSSVIMEQNASPDPSLQYPASLRKGKRGTFDARNTVDPDGEVVSVIFAFLPPETFDAEEPPESRSELPEESILESPQGDLAVLFRSFDDAGTWGVGLFLTDDRGGKTFAGVETFDVKSDLEPRISVASKTVAADNEIQFAGETGEGQDPLDVTWEWTFEGPFLSDGTAEPTTETKTGREVSHAFDTPGEYTVTLTVTGDGTAETSINVTVTPSIDPEIEVLSDPVTVDSQVRFEATSDLPIGVVGWEWFVQDADDPLANLGPDSGTPEVTGRIVGIDFADAGDYEVLVRGRHDGVLATASTTVTVDPSGVNAVADRVDSDTLYVDPDREATFTAIDSYDTDGEISTYTWYVDGERVEEGPEAVELSYSFSEEGGESKPVALVVEDEDGNTDRDEIPILVHTDEDRLGPEADIEKVAPDGSPVAPETTVRFSAVGSSDPNQDIEVYEWRVDGDVVRRADATDAFDERNPPDQFEYAFEAPSDGDTADHSVSVLVRDEEGFTDTAETTVTVETEDGGDDGDEDIGAGTEVIKRDRSDGTVYQTGTVTSKPASISSGDTVSVTGKITAKTDGAEGNIVYGVLGFDDGTILDVTEMPGTGSGTVTNEATVPSDASNRTVVWSFYAATSASAAKTAFGNEADRDDLANGPYGIVVGIVDG